MNTPGSHLGSRPGAGGAVPVVSRALGGAVAHLARTVARGIGGNPAQLRLARVLRSLAAMSEAEDTIQRIPVAEIPMARPTRLLRVDAFTPSAQIAPGVTSNDVPLQWPASGILVGISFGTIEGTPAALSALGVRILIEGNSDLFTNGKAGTFVNVGMLMGSPAVANMGFWPCIRWFDQGTIWDLISRNEALGGGVSITPTIGFHFVDPRDLEELAIATAARDAG